jgi:hypothetical protein
MCAMGTEHNVAEQIKTWLEVIQKLTLILVVVSFLAFPALWTGQLAKMGITQLKTPFADIPIPTQQAQAVAGQAQSVTRTVSDAVEALKTLSATLPASAQQKVSDVASVLETSAAPLRTSEKTLTDTLARAEQAAPQTTQRAEGWIYLGHVDESKTAWTAQPLSVQTSTPTFKAGDVVTITDDTYVRADSDTKQRNQAPVVGVVHVGEKVRVSDVAYTRALRGGYFLWLRIARV